MVEKENDNKMRIHSRFLVHWTGKNSDGKDIESQPAENRPQLYLDRLIDYYKQGLYTRRTSEDAVRGWTIKDMIRLCFTEVRLSQAQNHADRYGKLGLGFTRNMILERGGRPVIYIPYDAPDSSRLLENSIRKVFEESEDNPDIHRSAKWIMAHVKRMGDEHVADKFYEEMEWRIVYDESDKNRVFSRSQTDKAGEHRLQFSGQEVRFIVFPNEKTRQMALEDAIMQKHFAQHMPILVTLEECGHF